LVNDNVLQKQSMVFKPPPHLSLGELVGAQLVVMASGIHTAHTAKRECFSFKRLEPILGFRPADFNDNNIFSEWLKTCFFPRMVVLRVQQSLSIEGLRENCGHLSTWMLEQGVHPIIVRQFRTYVSIKRGQLWKQLVKKGGAVRDEKPRLTPADVLKLLKYTDKLLDDPTQLVSSNMKYHKKASEKKARYRVANKNIALNLHAALRMGLMTTKRPNEISSIRRSEINHQRVILRLSKVHRVGETTEYEMYEEYWPSFDALLKSHKKDTLFCLNHTSLSNWFKSLMLACGFKHHWFNIHRLRSFGGDILAMAGANELEMMAHGDWQNSDSVQAYIGEQGRKANLERASKKKHSLLKTLGLATTPEQTESELMMSLYIDLNETAHHDQGMWMNWVDTNETIGEILDRTHGSTMLNIQHDDEDENPSTQSDVNGLLSTKVVDVPSQQMNCFHQSHLWPNGQQSCFESFLVDVPRFELGASTMPR